MKLVVTALALVMAGAWLVPGDAEARSRGYRKAVPKKSYHATRRYYPRPASVGPNGLCQRDTGTPDSQLNFRNKCDVEEFWRRQNDRGSFGRW